MKLSALASIIKDCGHCSQITAANGHRFISTGHAVYNIDGYPKAQNKNELAAMLSIPSKKVEDIYFEEERAENNIYYGASLADDPDNEEPVDKLNTRIVVNGEEHIALRHPSGTIGFIRTALLGPEMRRNGAMFICNRCRKQVFAERFDDGLFDQKALDGWAIEARNFFGVGDLCPECYKVYRETMERFYEGGRHGT